MPCQNSHIASLNCFPCSLACSPVLADQAVNDLSAGEAGGHIDRSIKRKNQRGAGMAATLRVRLPRRGFPMRSVNWSVGGFNGDGAIFAGGMFNF